MVGGGEWPQPETTAGLGSPGKKDYFFPVSFFKTPCGFCSALVGGALPDSPLIFNTPVMIAIDTRREGDDPVCFAIVESGFAVRLGENDIFTPLNRVFVVDRPLVGAGNVITFIFTSLVSNASFPTSAAPQSLFFLHCLLLLW